MARKTILTLALAAATTLTAAPLLAQTAPAAPDCAADPAACQALVDRMGERMSPRADDDRREERRGGRGDDDDRRGKRGDRDGHRWGGHGGWGAGAMQRFDGNGDGTVSPEEVSTGVNALVTQFDADADQALTLEEFTALHAELTKPLAARSFAHLDANADGRIDAAETQAAVQRMTGGRGAPAAAPSGDAGGVTPAPSGAADAATGAATPAAPAATPSN